MPADGLEGGGQSSVRRVLFRNDGESKTLLQLVREKNAEQGREPTPRVDLHFGRSHDGRIFLLNKWDGVIREIVP